MGTPEEVRGLLAGLLQLHVLVGKYRDVDAWLTQVEQNELPLSACPYRPADLERLSAEIAKLSGELTEVHRLSRLRLCHVIGLTAHFDDNDLAVLGLLPADLRAGCSPVPLSPKALRPPPTGA